jgi:plastocyanin
MKKTVLIVITIALFITAEWSDSYAQEAKTARIYGRIILPAAKKKVRTFRGRLYRNRLSSAIQKRAAEISKRSSYEDVIIAAYPLSFKAEVKPVPNARVLQRNAVFIPNVLPITPGTTVEFINADRFFHNVFSISPGAKFNIGRRPTNDIVRKKINVTGEISLFCDIHSQMAATIISLDTPYFTKANRNGVYLLDSLPEGKYRLEIFHPDHEKIEVEITLSKGESSEQSFTLTD